MNMFDLLQHAVCKSLGLLCAMAPSKASAEKLEAVHKSFHEALNFMKDEAERLIAARLAEQTPPVARV
jgi:hypothetical protein